MTFWESLENILCVYKSTRFIRVKNRRLAIVYYTCLISVLIYICVFTVYAERGYQEFDPVTGTTSVKLKGTGSVGGALNTTAGTVYDAMDLVIPSIEEDVFFITTSMIVTPNQIRDNCPGNRDVGACNTANYTHVCKVGTYTPKSQGIYTGNCCYSQSPNNCSSHYNRTYAANDRCEVKSWCPLETDDKSAQVPIVNIGAFTAFVKVDITFSAFGVSRSNTEDRNHGAPVDGYNLFSLDEIIRAATHGKITNVSHNITYGGAVILMQSQWDCNLDKGENNCNPDWHFYRIDIPDSMSSGFNYRTVNYDVPLDRRTLRKLYGIRVVFTTTGQGGRFSLAQLSVTFGAGLAYLGAAAFIADIVLERFLPESQTYAKLKTKVTGDAKIAMGKVVQTETDDRYHDLDD